MDIKKLAQDMAQYYAEEKLIKRLLESDHEILQEIGDQVLNEEGFPEWVKLRDVRFDLQLITTYSFDEWEALAKAVFDIENIKDFVTHDMYELFIEFIELFDLRIYIKTDPEEITE
ncbi:hypothetical protein [Staphylococcus delphini]|uniref:hypothetical protein n=1 Tax=Staphylococcus delphini TaxID=53344 RepID=UPI000BBC7CDA|nr:hypothetical protein [Staphylococcus delphini]PCF80086.1 hypothetical protein B4W69_12960 [Staphylococcus delphini]